MAEFASNGKGNLGVTLGAIGTGLGVLGPHVGDFLGIRSTSSNYVSKESFDLEKEITDLKTQNSLLKADQNTEIKIADVFERLSTRIRELENKEADNWSGQGVINAQVGANLSVMQNQIATFNSLTKTIIPINNVCPEPMKLYNSWTAPTA